MLNAACSDKYKSANYILNKVLSNKMEVCQMDLRCGCCGGEISWADVDVLESAPKSEVIIFTCMQCKCGYDTSASRTHVCEELGKNIFKFTAPSREKNAGENRIRKSYRMEQRPVFKPMRTQERFAGREKDSKHSFGSILFELLFGWP